MSLWFYFCLRSFFLRLKELGSLRLFTSLSELELSHIINTGMTILNQTGSGTERTCLLFGQTDESVQLVPVRVAGQAVTAAGAAVANDEHVGKHT